MKNLIIILFIFGLFGLYQACSTSSSSGDGDVSSIDEGSGTTSSSKAIFGTSLLDSSNFGN